MSTSQDVEGFLEVGATVELAPDQWWRKPWVREWSIVVLTLMFLQVLVFRGFYSGAFTPQFDFTGQYSLDAYAWWHDGSFFDPPQWARYMYGGFPAIIDLQNSSFYLPVGVAASIVPYTLRVAATVSALHVAFGSVGAYVFVRRWGASANASLVALASWFFAVGFYSNASHVDIMRAYAWLPWVLLVTSTKWPWQRWWAPLVGTLILWQAILGSYPGTLVAFGYVVVMWIIANQLLARPSLTKYLVPLAVTGLAAVMMTLVRFLPALAARGAGVSNPDESVLTWSLLGTVLYSENNPALPGYVGFRSFFIPAPVLALLAFVPVRQRFMKFLLVVAGVTLALALPIWPWHSLVSELPGMSLSRFRMADFKPAYLFLATVAAAFAFDGLARRHLATDEATIADPGGHTSRRVVERSLPWVLLALLLAGLGAIGLRYHYAAPASRRQWILLAGSAAVLLVWAERRWRLRRGAIGVTVIAIAVSGLLQADALGGLFKADREAVELQSYGAPVADLIDQRHDEATTAQRPPRVPPEFPPKPGTVMPPYDAVFYTGQASVSGYLNLRGTETFEIVKNVNYFLEGEAGDDARAFWSAAGIVVEGPPDSIPTRSTTDACATVGVCGEGLTVTPLEYGTDGHFVYEVDAARDLSVMLNEAHYDGWHAELCPADGDGECMTIQTARGSIGQITTTIPAGAWTLTLNYRTPGRTAGFAFFWLGVALATGLAAWTAWRQRRFGSVAHQSSQNSRTQTGPAAA